MPPSEKNVLKRQHGLFVSACFVVGFIVGTGIFFLPGRVLYEAGGSVGVGTLAWIIGALMIAPCVLMFGIFAGKYEKIHGFVDYSEAIVGKKYGYLAGWFFAVMYQPAGYAIIAWITSGFTATMVGISAATHDTYLAFRFFITAFYMAAAFVMNFLTPKIPVKFNVATTVARLIPLVAMGTVGVVAGLFFSRGGEEAYTVATGTGGGLFAAISATAFAFNGWQASLAFNSEVKDSKKKFPLALLLGFGLVAIVYVLYFIGVTGASAAARYTMMQGGGAFFADGTRMAFSQIFGGAAGNILVFFMIISGLGILNACCLGMARAMYSLGRRGSGVAPGKMAELTPEGVPANSMVLAVGLGFIWLAVIFANQAGWFGNFTFSLPDFYNFAFFALLVPIFLCHMLRAKTDKPLTRYAFPLLATIGAAFMFATYWIGSPQHALVYTAVFIALAIIGMLFFNTKSDEE
jgi:APA family basic amino acid/polyamine antiporter